jgi:hypothetical protein
VELQPGETVIHSAQVVWLGGPGPRPGTLTLTNQALIFEGPVPTAPPGANPNAPSVLAPGVRRIPLWRCREAKSSPGPAGGPRLELDLLQHSIFFRVPDPQAWATGVNQARANAPPAPPGAMAGGGGGGGGTSGAAIAARRAAMPRCEYCGNLSPPMATHCKSCGAPLPN